MNANRALRILAPYAAVLIFWCVFEDAWLAILAYHAQILLLSRKQLRLLGKGWDPRLFAITALPCVLAGPLTYLLLPFMTGPTGLAEWLARFGLTGIPLGLMVPYFGLVHPLLEEAHWSDLRSLGWPAHLAFAGYHALVLASLLPPLWVGLCFVVLVAASITWTFAQSQAKPGLLVCAFGHTAADLGLILAAVLRAG